MSTLSQFFGGSSAQTIPCELLVVGGGGAGGAGNSVAIPGGGGGAGQLVLGNINISQGNSYIITVGSGGNLTSFGGYIAAPGTKGGNSSQDGTDSYFGGSSGGGGSDSTTEGAGGGGGALSAGAIAQGTGLPGTMLITTNWGIIDGGTWAAFSNSGSRSAQVSTGRNGGTGYPSNITGSSVTYAQGGDGASAQTNTTGANGAANTGNGGGGSCRLPAGTTDGGTGGSGIVVIAYPNTYPAPTSITGTYNEPTRSGYRVYRFTGSGSITF